MKYGKVIVRTGTEIADLISSGEPALMSIGGLLIELDEGASNLLKRYYSGDEIIFGEDYIARKLWCEEDVRMKLKEAGYTGTDEQVCEVINTGYLKALGDCNDIDWNIIDYAISEANLKENIA